MRKFGIMLLTALVVMAAVPALAEYGEWEQIYTEPGPIPGMSGFGFTGIAVENEDFLYGVGAKQTGDLSIESAWMSGDGGYNWNLVWGVDMTGVTDCTFLNLMNILLAAAVTPSGRVVYTGTRIDPECIENGTFPACIFTCSVQIGTYIVYSDDGGATLTEATINAPIQMHITTAVTFVDENVGYAVGMPNYVLKTEDGGETWNQITVQGATLASYYNDVQFVTPDLGFLVSGLPDEEKINLEGVTDPAEAAARVRHWQRLASDPWYRAEWFAAHPDQAKASMGKVYRTTDGGATWELVKQATGEGFVDIEMVNETEGWLVAEIAGGAKYPVYHTTDGGDTWEDVSDRFPDSVPGSNSYRIVRGEFQPDGKTGFFYGGGRTLISYKTLVIYTEDGGETFQTDEEMLGAFPTPILAFGWANPKFGFGVGLDMSVFTYTVANIAPSADAGEDFAATTGETAALDGSGSNDPDGDELAFIWTQTNGPTAELTGADTAAPSFTPSEAGTYEFLLTVSDGVEEDTDSVVVTVTGDDDDSDDDADDDADDDNNGDDDNNDSGCGC